MRTQSFDVKILVEKVGIIATWVFTVHCVYVSWLRCLWKRREEVLEHTVVWVPQDLYLPINPMGKWCHHCPTGVSPLYLWLVTPIPPLLCNPNILRIIFQLADNISRVFSVPCRPDTSCQNLFKKHSQHKCASLCRRFQCQGERNSASWERYTFLVRFPLPWSVGGRLTPDLGTISGVRVSGSSPLTLKAVSHRVCIWRQYPKIGDFKKWKFSVFLQKIIACRWVLAQS